MGTKHKYKENHTNENFYTSNVLFGIKQKYIGNHVNENLRERDIYLEGNDANKNMYANTKQTT